MAQADGTILIDTEIDADGMKAGSKEVEAAARNMAASIDDLGTKAKTALSRQVDAFSKLNSEFSAQSKKVDKLKKKVAEYGNQKIPTSEYQEIQNQIDQSTQKMDRLIAAQERFVSLGGDVNSNQYKRYQYDIDELSNTIKYAKGELQDLIDTGKAFTPGTGTKEYAADVERLEAAVRKLSDMNNKLGTSYSSIKGQVEDYKNSLLKTDAAQKKTSASGNKVAKSLSNTAKASNKASFGIGKMLGTSILFSFAFQAINGALTAVKDGFSNLAQYSSSTNSSISMLWSSLERLKNSLATAFAPILDVIAPILSRFIDMLSEAASYVSMFFSFLTGKSTYTKALAVQKDYAASLEDTATGAQDAADATEEATKAAEGYLSPIDEINKYSSGNTNASNNFPSVGGSGAGTGQEGPMFEEVEIPNNFIKALDKVIKKLKEIKKIFDKGFWDGLGDYKPALEDLQNDLKSIGKSIVDIFTDADVQGAANNFARNFIYALGQVVGSFASIGLSIARNIVGGIEKYLSQNVGRIKNYIIDMFNVGSELVALVGNFASAFADVIAKTFGSETAQQITGNIIGIFAEVGMLVSSLALKLVTDIANIIVTPFIENKERITQAILGTLEAIEPFTTGLLTAVQTISDALTRLYDEHIGPFFESIASGLSTIIGALLDGYNTYILPILQGLGEKFQELMEGPFGEMVEKVEEFIGRLIDALNMLWNNVLVPILTWLAEKFFPVISPAVEALGNLALETIEFIIKAIGNIADVLSGIIDFIVGVFTGDWELAWTGVQEIFDGIWNLIVDILDTCWDAIKELVSTALRVVKNSITTAWEGIKTLTSTIWDGITNTIEGFWDNIEKASEVFNNIKNTVSKAWEAIKDKTHTIWEGLTNWIPDKIQAIRDAIVNKFEDAKETVEGIFEGIVNTVKNVINGAIEIVNNAIGTINGAIAGIESAISFGPWDIPMPFGGSVTIGFQATFPRVGTIPYLASGAVIPPNKEFMAVLGDQKHGTNIEAPLETIKQAVRDVNGESGIGGGLRIPIYINGRQVFEAVLDEAQLKRMRSGNNPFMLGGAY